jgi:hypothetical protein
VITVKIGEKYDVPEVRLYPTLVGATKAIYEKFSSEEAENPEVIAKLLGHKTANSGAFLTKLACLRSYGLVERRGLRVTDLGKKLTFPTNDQEENEAVRQAILNIPLWSEFYVKWGTEPPNGNFWVDLAKITGLDAPEAQKVARDVRRAYLDDISHLKPEILPVESVSAKPVPVNVLGRLETAEYGTLTIRDAGSISVAKSILELIERKLKSSEKAEPEKE